jgi:hypothetical protein
MVLPFYHQGVITKFTCLTWTTRDTTCTTIIRKAIGTETHPGQLGSFLKEILPQTTKECQRNETKKEALGRQVREIFMDLKWVKDHM